MSRLFYTWSLTLFLLNNSLKLFRLFLNFSRWTINSCNFFLLFLNNYFLFSLFGALFFGLEAYEVFRVAIVMVIVWGLALSWREQELAIFSLRRALRCCDFILIGGVFFLTLCFFKKTHAIILLLMFWTIVIDNIICTRILI